MALRGAAEFRTGDHSLLMGAGRDNIRWRHTDAAETTLRAAWAAAPKADACRMEQIMWVGTWLSVLPSTTNGTELRSQEWRDPLFLRYSIDPHAFPENYDGCGASFYICHTLN